MNKEDMIPMDNPFSIPIQLRFTQEHYEKLLKGFIPEMMEDKWFICLDDNTIHCYRSWTGFENYRAKLINETDSNGVCTYAVKELITERNADKYTNTDEQRDIDLFTKIIAYLVVEANIEDIKEGV